ncbi:MAG: saccharopine dehydrogenase [Elainellaceae cyanobacterium]
MTHEACITIGIRRENEDRKFEARVPLVPADVQQLKEQLGDRVRFIVQPARLRTFSDAEFAAAGAIIQEDLSEADMICCVKELYPEQLLDGKTYLVFAHVIKGQPDNMPLLQRLLDRHITLIDYECITDEAGRRTVFFGRSAGQTGMFETLRAFGQRCAALGKSCVFQELKPVYEYTNLTQAKAHLQTLGDRLQQDPTLLGVTDYPLVAAIAGLGNVGQGAREILQLLSPQTVSAEALPALFASGRTGLFQCPLRKSGTLRNADGLFDSAEYATFPDRYSSRIPDLLSYFSILLNCVFWAPQYPRILPHEAFQAAWQYGTRRLQVVGDLSCDPPAGSVACTVQAGDLYNPVFGYDPETRAVLEPFSERGVTVMAVDNLSAGLPHDASIVFSEMLRDYISPLVTARLHETNWADALPPALFRATVTHQGRLMKNFQALRPYLEKYGSVAQPV